MKSSSSQTQGEWKDVKKLWGYSAYSDPAWGSLLWALKPMVAMSLSSPKPEPASLSFLCSPYPLFLSFTCPSTALPTLLICRFSSLEVCRNVMNRILEKGKEERWGDLKTHILMRSSMQEGPFEWLWEGQEEDRPPPIERTIFFWKEQGFLVSLSFSLSSHTSVS